MVERDSRLQPPKPGADPQPKAVDSSLRPRFYATTFEFMLKFFVDGRAGRMFRAEVINL